MVSFRRPGARAVVTLLAGVTLAVGAAGTPVAAAPSDSAGRFIITVADAHDSRSVAGDYRRKGADVDFVYTAALNGFAGEMSQAELGELQRDRRVTRIERDGIATASETTQTNATWGLDRIDARSGLDGKYTYTPTGAGVSAYIIDTGIRFDHAEVAGRVTFGYDAFGGAGEDCNGHGTHVAGTVGGSVYGVAKGVSLVAVRVLDCGGSGTWSGVIAGMDWATGNHAAGTPAVANMSLGGGASSSVDAAIQRMHGDGITVVVAAGNGNQGGKEQDACGYSPARAPEAITTGATTNTDTKTSWSNYGDCVDLFAPGAGITSAWYTGSTDTKTISGTSMAAPHVAGVAALYLQGNTGALPQLVRDTIVATASQGVVTSSKTTNNHLVYSKLTTEVVSNGTIAGTVTSESGSTVIAGASVTAGGVSRTTDEFGEFTIELPPGTYEVTASATDYTARTVTGVEVKSGAETLLPIALASSNGGSDGGSDPVIEDFTLTATPLKVKGVKTADITWSGTASTSVDLFIDGAFDSKVESSDRSARVTVVGKGGGSHTLQVCEVGSAPSSEPANCSNTSTVTY